jgi:hypothetical protein
VSTFDPASDPASGALGLLAAARDITILGCVDACVGVPRDAVPTARFGQEQQGHALAEQRPCYRYVDFLFPITLKCHHI